MSATSLDGLIDEIRDEPELAEPDLARQRAEARLEQHVLIEQVIFEAAMGSRYDGRAYRQLFDDLWLYSWPVIKAFLRLGRMGQVLRQYAPHYGVAVSPEDLVVLHRSEAERDALALDIIARAVEHFYQRAILKRQWSPTKGASLRTWFIGTCALDFPRAYAQWSRNRSDQLTGLAGQHNLDLDTLGERLAAQVPDPERVAANRDDLRTMINQAQPMTKLILGMLMEGMTHAEIAHELDLTVRAVEGRLYRFRQRVLTRRQAAREVFPPVVINARSAS